MKPRKPLPGGAGGKEFEQEATEGTEWGFKCSNVEAMFSMIRRKFGDSVRRKTRFSLNYVAANFVA